MKPKFKPGDQVQVEDYGVLKTGEVTSVGRNGGMIYVKLADSPRIRWFHAESLTKIGGYDATTN